MTLPQWYEKPEPIENVDNWQWLTERCWRVVLEWHQAEGYDIRCTFDAPAHPIGSRTIQCEHKDRKAVLALARQTVAAELLA